MALLRNSYPVASEDAFRGLYSHTYDLLVGSLPSTNTLEASFPGD